MFNFLTSYTGITWFGTIYAFHKPLVGPSQFIKHNLFQNSLVLLISTDLAQILVLKYK